MFNIFKNANIRNDTGCRHDNNVGWSVAWTENDDFKSYTTTSGVTTELVWDRNYVFVTTSGVCYTGPSTDQTAFDASIYSQLRVNYRVETSETTVIVPTTGKIQFQTSADPAYDSEKEIEFEMSTDNAYNEYIIDMSGVRDWVGNVTRIRLYPFIDGDEGYVVHIKSIEARSVNSFSCDTIYKKNLCDKYSEYSHPCPWVGAGGSCQSATVSGSVTIEEDINDQLIVDINGYGSHSVIITPVVSARLEEVSRDIESKLSNIAIAGYFGNKVVVENKKIKIIADDTRESISTVTVLDTPAARTLGFYTDEGISSSLSLSGEDAASEYVPVGTVSLSKAQLSSFYAEDQLSTPGISLDVNRYSLRGGRADYITGFSDRKLDVSGKTVIDFNNPINSTGKLASVAFSGDGDSSTEFRIFRPQSDGTITHIHSIPMGIPDGSDDSNFETATNVRVRKGDFLGIYNCKIARGKTQDLPNGSYILYNGDLKEGNSIKGPQEVFERGDAGLRLFAHGQDRETEAAIDIEFEQLEMVEAVTVIAEEEERVEEINLTHAKVGGINGGIYITGTTGLDKFGAQAPPLTNLGALIDGVKHVSPGATDSYPSWLDGTVDPPDLYDQTPFSYALDFALGTNVFFNINKVNIYFRDTFNIKYFSLEYPLTTNIEDTEQYWGPVADNYSLVSIEGTPLLPNDHPLYENPTHPTISNYIDSYQSLDYRVLGIEFPEVRARSIRYKVENAFFDDRDYASTLSNYIIAPNPRIMEIEVFAKSVPTASISDNFSFESSQDGLNYVLHSNVKDTGQTSAEYLIGYPVKNIRARMRPQGRLDVGSLTANVSIGNTSIFVDSVDGTLSLNAAQDDFTSFQTIRATNKSSSTYNYYINIAAQRGTVGRCILWNKLSSKATSELSEIGPSPTIKKRSDFSLREYNYSYNLPSYILDPVWLANANAISYVSYDSSTTWEFYGNTLTDYNPYTSITSVSPQFGSHPLVYILVDLGDVYDLETVQTFSSESNTTFAGPAYSALNVSDPSSLDVINDFGSTQISVRWLRYTAPADLVTSSNISDITYIDISLDAASRRNKGKLRWISAPKLTNYITANLDPNDCGEGWSCPNSGFTHWYVVDLQNHQNITNIITGPQESNFEVDDFDTLLPGGLGSEYTSSSKSNSNIAYSSSSVANPSQIDWEPLGQEPRASERWILLKAPSSLKDEVIVHVDDNVQQDKDVFANSSWWSASLGTVYEDNQEFIESPHSIAIDYAASTGPSLETIELNQSLGIDHELAPRDNLRILLFISDITQLDLTTGSIKIGRSLIETQEGVSPWSGADKDTENYFEWPMSSIASLLETGWNEIYLPFTGNFKVGEPYFTSDDFLNWSYKDSSGKSRFKWFSVSFSGIPNNKTLGLKVDGLKIVRASYTAAHFGNGLYLANEEYAKFALDNFNTVEGTVEFYLNPEWSKDPICNSCEDPRDHAIFRAFNDDGFVIALLMTGQGLRVYLTNGDKHYFLTDGSNSPIVLGENTHIAVTWDLLGSKSDSAIKLFIDGVISTTMDLELVVDEFKPNSSAVFMLGGIAWDGLTGDKSSSVDGTVENLKVYNYAKSEFSHSIKNQNLEYTRPSEELVDISVDAENFYGSGSRGAGLPLLVRDVPSGGSFNIYVKNRNNTTGVQAPGESRTSYVEIIRSSS
jgi:hypothetical protein